MAEEHDADADNSKDFLHLARKLHNPREEFVRMLRDNTCETEISRLVKDCSYAEQLLALSQTYHDGRFVRLIGKLYPCIKLKLLHVLFPSVCEPMLNELFPLIKSVSYSDYSKVYRKLPFRKRFVLRKTSDGTIDLFLKIGIDCSIVFKNCGNRSEELLNKYNVSFFTETLGFQTFILDDVGKVTCFTSVERCEVFNKLQYSYWFVVYQAQSSSAVSLTEEEPPDLFDLPSGTRLNLRYHYIPNLFNDHFNPDFLKLLKTRNYETKFLRRLHDHFPNDEIWSYLGTQCFEKELGEFLQGKTPANSELWSELPLQYEAPMDSCPICCKQFRYLEYVVKFECICVYRFHRDCVKPWLRKCNYCPVCCCELPTTSEEYRQQQAKRKEIMHTIYN